MRSLFLKIFLWFWLTMGLLGVMVALVTTAMQPQIMPERFRALSGDALTYQARTAVTILEHDGPDALRDFLLIQGRRPWARGFGHTLLLDEQGRDVLGRPALPGMGKLIAKTAQSDQPMFELGDRESFAAVAVSDSQGHRYVLVRSMPPRPSRMAWTRMLWARPGTQLLRILVVFLSAGLVCFWLARQLTAPVTRLRAVTQRFASGDLGARVGTAVGKRGDELTELGRDFDHMAERIDSLVSAQRRLFRDMSHELRSPLARLSIALGLARQRSTPEAGSALDRIEHETDRLNLLIGQLLTLVWMEQGTEAAEKESVFLTDLVREIAADADFEARSRNCTVRVASAEECTTTGNAKLLRSAIENVIRNAVRHTAEGCEVEIALRCHREADDVTAVIAVRDRGSGVPRTELANLFRPFYRASNTEDQKSVGAGLGLAITERAVRLHNGTVTATNAAGGGLLITMRLPVTKPNMADNNPERLSGAHCIFPSSRNRQS